MIRKFCKEFCQKGALVFIASISLAGCSGVGVATGLGAATGVAAVKEGGIRQTMSDAQIKASINDLWFKYNLETFAKLNLNVNQGRVLVTGIVQNPEHRLEAIRLVWTVDGVQQVINEIQVAESEGIKGYARDAWISTRLRAQLTVNKYIQSLNYSIETVQATVYLMGVAQDQAELDRVIDVARSIPHVRQVVSYAKMAGPDADTGSADGSKGVPPSNFNE